MINSMTAFSRQELQGEYGTLVMELRTVNHRFLDPHFRLPEDLRFVESALRELFAKRLSRGKLDCSLRLNAASDGGGELQVNLDLVKQLAKASREIDAILYEPSPVSSMELLKWPGVLQNADVGNEQMSAAVLQLANQAIDELLEVRRREGEKLAAMIEQRARTMEQIVVEVRKACPEILQRQKNKLLARLEESEVDLEPGRLEQELVIYAQKLDVTEEMDRLETHLQELQRILAGDGPVGRRLDFLLQELNREANTLSSKSVDTSATHQAVELKVLIEQIREQVQNIE